MFKRCLKWLNIFAQVNMVKRCDYVKLQVLDMFGPHLSCALLLSRLAIDGIVHTSAVFHAAFPEHRSKMYQRHPKIRNRKGLGMALPGVQQGFTFCRPFRCQTKSAAPPGPSKAHHEICCHGAGRTRHAWPAPSF